MSRVIPFDIGQVVHARVLGVTEKIVEGHVVVLRDKDGNEKVQKEEFVSAEFEGKVLGISVVAEGDGSARTTYAVECPQPDAKFGRRWVEERFLTSVAQTAAPAEAVDRV